MLTFGFIGIGQAGGLLADDAKKMGYPSLAINTAQVDLQALPFIGDEYKFHLYGYEGAGKDRQVGAEAFYAHQSPLMDTICEEFPSSHVLFVAAALGGGSGSGIAPLLIRRLTQQFPNKVVCPILFLPHKEETMKSRINALESFAEISEIKETGASFIFDNQNILDLHQTLPLREKYRHTRQEFLDALTFFNQQTNQQSGISNLDQMDLLTALAERGAASFTVCGVEESDFLVPDRIGERILKRIEYSPVAASDFSSVPKAAVVLQLPTALTGQLSVESFFEPSLRPLEMYAGVFEQSERPKLSTLLSGASFPFKRLKDIEESVRREESRMISSIHQARTQQFTLHQNWGESIKSNKKISIN